MCTESIIIDPDYGYTKESFEAIWENRMCYQQCKVSLLPAK